MKLKKILGLCLISVMLVLALAACSKSSGDSNLVGKWEYKLEGVTVITYEFKSNGTCTVNVGGEEASADYTVKDGKIVVEGEELAYKIDGDTLTLTVEGVEMPLTKVK